MPGTWLSRQNARGRYGCRQAAAENHRPEIVIRQNEKLLLLLAARANKKDAELLEELKKINRKKD